MKTIKSLLILAAITLAACSKVPVGNVGVKVYLLGGAKGVDSEELSPGRYWIGVNEELFLFPTFTQTYDWSFHQQGPDESLTFQTVEGLSVNADLGITYHINPLKVSSIFEKYRKGIDEVTDIYLRNMVRDSLVRKASSLPIESVYGKGKSDLISSVQADVVAQVEPLGIVIEKLYWIGDLRLPPTVIASINAKIEATQKAQQRENEVAQATAEANKKIEDAKGEAQSIYLVAKATADGINLKGAALRDNPKLVEFTAVEKWDGVLPQVAGGAVPFINLKANP